jgi:hypothetical protein
MTRPPSEAVDLTHLIPYLHEQLYHIGDLQLAGIVLGDDSVGDVVQTFRVEFVSAKSAPATAG